MRTSAFLVVAAVAVMSIGAENCTTHDPGGTGGSPNFGGFVGTGGSVTQTGGSTVTDAEPACTDACCETCVILRKHTCPEGLSDADGTCEQACRNSEQGPALLRWSKLSGDPSLEVIQSLYECTGGT